MELNPLAQIDLVVVASTIAIFIATYAVMRKVFFDRTIATMEARNLRCIEAQAACENAEELIRDAQELADNIVREAQAEADTLVSTAREEAEAEKSARVAAARERAEQQLQDGRREIMSAREREIASLRTEARECVGLACEKLAGTADPEVVVGVVDRLITKTLQ